MERCSNKIHEGKQHQDGGQFFRNMGVWSKGKRERARGLMGSDFCRILPRLHQREKAKKGASKREFSYLIVPLFAFRQENAK